MQKIRIINGASWLGVRLLRERSRFRALGLRGGKLPFFFSFFSQPHPDFAPSSALVGGGFLDGFVSKNSISRCAEIWGHVTMDVFFNDDPAKKIREKYEMSN